MKFLRRACAGWLLLAALCAGSAETNFGPNLFSFDRMGAGVPAGWRLTGENYAWTVEPRLGPLGAGAARIRFAGKGSVSLESPATAMRSEVRHLLRVRVRSEPGGATVRIRLRDNGFFPTGSVGVPLSGECVATGQWQPMVLQGQPPRAKGEHYYVELQIAGENQTAWLDGLYVGEWRGGASEATASLKIHPAGVVLKPEAPWGLVTGQEQMRVQATVVGATAPGAKLLMRAVHTTGITEVLPLILLDGQPVWDGTIQVTGRSGNLFGMTRLEATVVGADGRPLSAMAETLLARVPPPVPGRIANSPFGIHVAFREPDLAVAAKLGYKWCRVHDASGATKWGILERKRGRWSWQDDDVLLPGRYGLGILGMLDTSPPWASGLTSDGYWSIYGVPRNLDDWRNYVRNVVARYARVIDRWEVWNEPWLNAGTFLFFQNGSPQKYRELLQAAWEEARKVNPQATIVGIDTFSAQWDQAVLSAGAYPFYDVMSFHRYDHSLHGHPRDTLALEAGRLRSVQAKYGTPKPLELTEGGPDVALYQGSFFSFADARLTGDWQRGADQYARMFLGVIAAGIQRFTAYSIHGVPRHGNPTHMMVEPGPLLRPLHLTVSALAQFVEGARYEGCLAPTHDISAHLFAQPNARYFAAEPGTVVALIANGEEPEPLPNPLPPGMHCFDRWGNPTDIPTHATRGITYLVATGAEQKTLRDALKTAPESPACGAGVEGLLQATLGSLNQGTPPLWSLCSSLGSLATLADGKGVVSATRATLRNDPALAKRFRLPGVRVSGSPELQQAGVSLGGWVGLQANDGDWVMTFTAVPDGPQGRWRLITVTLVPRAGALSENQLQPATDLLKQWEQGVGKGDILGLRETLADLHFCVLFAMPNAQVLANRDYFTTQLHGLVVHGMKKSSLSLSHAAGAGCVATVIASWEVDSSFMGPMTLGTTATLINEGGKWKLKTLGVGPQLPLVTP